MQPDTIIFELNEELQYKYNTSEPRKPWLVKLLILVSTNITPWCLLSCLIFALFVVVDYWYLNQFNIDVFHKDDVTILLIPAYLWIVTKVTLAVIYDDYGFNTNYIMWFEQNIANLITIILLEMSKENYFNASSYEKIEKEALQFILVMMSKTHYDLSATPNIRQLKQVILELKLDNFSESQIRNTNLDKHDLEQKRKLLEHLYTLK
jgi:hypothetical protein